MAMSLQERLAALSPTKLALVHELLREKAELLPGSTIQPRGKSNKVELSFAQQRLWFLNQLEPGSPFYNISMAVRISGNVDMKAFVRALNEIIRRHEVLRTSFQPLHGTPVQVIIPRLLVNPSIVDLSELSRNGEAEQEALRLVNADSRRPFDLSKSPLLRVVM